MTDTTTTRPAAATAVGVLAVIGVIGIWFGSTRHRLGEGDGPEFFTLLLASTVGMMLMGSTSHLLMLLLSVGFVSIASTMAREATLAHGELPGRRDRPHVGL